MPSKYDALARYLDGLPQDSWRARFTEIEKILGFDLPRSARLYQAWWANELAPKTHVQKKSWSAAGWQTEELHLRGEQVTFRRIRT